METITNIASTATSTVSNLIYGNQDAATKTNETTGKEPVSGQLGKGTADEPYDQGNSEDALKKSTGSTVEPTGSVQTPEDLIKAYKNEAGDSTTSTTGSAPTAVGITDKAGVTDQVWKPTDVDAVKPSVVDPAAAPETGVGAQDSSATGKDTLWRGVDAYKDTSATGSASAKPISGEATTDGPKGAVDAEPKNYSIGDLTSGKETAAKPVGETTTSANTTSQSDSKTGESATSPPDLSTTSPGDKPDFSADTHKPSPNSAGTWTHKVGNVLNKADGVAGLVGERAGHGGPATAIPEHQKSSSASPSGDDDEKTGKMDKLKDKLKTKLHIGH
ncbi:hypothetical protein OPT61_g4400 [Boeremia exigua]|uniref:Uncharacterized protein n=1 Tax=Boeremia exigua TaxID=749465 RepID=A0ACC2IE97_9PLEO|nr:hypothetical protein OPT61_g4400 [Boeremia exigua]